MVKELDSIEMSVVVKRIWLKVTKIYIHLLAKGNLSRGGLTIMSGGPKVGCRLFMASKPIPLPPKKTRINLSDQSQYSQTESSVVTARSLD